MAVRMMVTASTNCATVTQAGQWLAGVCPPEPPWPGVAWAPSAVQMTSGPRTSSTRDAAIDGTSDGAASTLLRRARMAIHPGMRLCRRTASMAARLGAVRVPVNRLHLPRGSGLRQGAHSLAPPPWQRSGGSSVPATGSRPETSEKSRPQPFEKNSMLSKLRALLSSMAFGASTVEERL